MTSNENIFAKINKNKTNELLNILNDVKKEEENRIIENNTQALLRKISPTNSSDLKMLAKKIENLQNQVSLILKKVSENKIDDPRIENNPLPNESNMTYEFGARSYKTSCYPDYTWRNGYWYKISSELKFELIGSEDSLNLSSILLEDKHPDITAQIDDYFYPIIYDNVRYFVKDIWEQDPYYNGKRFVNTRNYVYIPDAKACVNWADSDLEQIIKSSATKFEDPEFMKKIKSKNV